jgi:multisubunit Na+/H+ antiporter MnhC subunit
MVPLSWYLIFAATLFSIGLFGALSRRNAIAILLGIELMLNSVNINLAAFWRYGDVTQMGARDHRLCVRRGRPLVGADFRSSSSQHRCGG